MSVLSVAKKKITGKTFGERLRSARLLTRGKNRKAMTQQELADTVGIHRVTLVEYEGDKKVPPVDVAWKLADAVGVSLDDLRGADSESE